MLEYCRNLVVGGLNVNINKQRCNLQIAPLSYPWQVVEGDGESWVILRCKCKLTLKEVMELHGATLEDFAWKVSLEQGENHLYQGKIALNIYYNSKSFFAIDKEFAESDEEEDLIRTSIINEESSKEVNFREETEYSSDFASIIVDKEELTKKEEEDFSSAEVWNVEIPWQAWLHGMGQDREPLVEKVHVAQVGLSSLLVEALIKLEKKQDPLKSSDDNEIIFKNTEELYFTIQEEKIAEIGGLHTVGSFFTTYFNSNKQLTLENLKKINLVFISDITGGERFWVASHIIEEKNILNLGENLQVQPADFQCYKKKLKLILYDDHTVIWKAEYMIRAMFAENMRSMNIVQEEAPKTVETKEPVPRKRPGEKWLKKGRNNNSKTTTNKTLISIKLGI